MRELEQTWVRNHADQGVTHLWQVLICSGRFCFTGLLVEVTGEGSYLWTSTRHGRADVHSSAPDVVTLFGSRCELACSWTHMMKESHVALVETSLACLIFLKSFIQAIMCVWDNVPLICVRIANVFVMLLMDLLLILGLRASSSISLIMADIQLFFSAADPLADLWLIINANLWLVSGRTVGAKCRWLASWAEAESLCLFCLKIAS